jgi:hypothetical protein
MAGAGVPGVVLLIVGGGSRCHAANSLLVSGVAAPPLVVLGGPNIAAEFPI